MFETDAAGLEEVKCFNRGIVQCRNSKHRECMIVWKLSSRCTQIWFIEIDKDTATPSPPP